MVEFVAGIAGFAIGIKAVHEETQELFRDYLTNEPPQVYIESGRCQILAERQLMKMNDANGSLPVDEFSDSQIESNYLYREVAEQLSTRGVILMHGSAVALEGEAYIFVAPSGTGKSTHARLWCEAFGDRAAMINDDKPLIRCAGGSIHVYGSPWNGKHQLGTNICVPLKAICFLERGEENRIERVSAEEAFLPMLKAVYQSRETKRETCILELLQKLRRWDSFYRLSCNMMPEAALIAHKGMNDGK